MYASVTEGNTHGANVVKSSRLFALLIGINTYCVNATNGSTNDTGFRASAPAGTSNPHDITVFEDLRGAVADAQDFYDYFVEILNVPKSQITFLRDEEATRDNIIKAFQSLATNEDIKKGDSIFIFYAGHGAQAYPPLRLKKIGGCPPYIEVLVPHDFNKNPGNARNMGIPDYTLAVLLNNISKEKGDKITVVFDCCHAASALRGTKPAPDQRHVLTRSGPELKYPLPDDLDKDIWGSEIRTRGLTAPPSLRHLGTSAYIFFSACTSAQMAREVSSRGCFTQALLEYLKRGTEGTRVTCSNIIPALKRIDGQDPQCQGKNSNERSIFHGYTPRNNRGCFDIYYGAGHSKSSDLTLKAGTHQGLNQGDELTVHASKAPEDMKSPIATVVIVKVSPEASSLQLTSGSRTFSSSQYPHPVAVLAASKTKQEHFLVYIEKEDRSLYERVRATRTCTLARKLQDAHIYLSSVSASQGRDKQLCFAVVDDELAKRKIELKAHYTPDTDRDLIEALNGLSHYYYHLKRTSSSLPTNKITLSLFQVEDTNIGSPRIDKVPGSYNLLSQDGAAVIDLVQDVESLYGLEIRNNMLDGGLLFPVLLYFDNSDFTITHIFPHAAPVNNTEALWPATGQPMTIGYGVGPGSDITPFEFFLAEGNDVEAGFFKLFLFDTPADLRSVEQDQPVFTKSRGLKRPQTMLQIVKPPISRWGSITVTVVIQKREKNLTAVN